MSKTTDEALARLEHKVDMLLDIVMRAVSKAYVPEMKSGSHECPVCKVGVKYIFDMLDNSVTRQCGCKTGLIAPIDLEQFAPPLAAGGRDGERDRDSAADRDPERGRDQRAKGRSR